MPGNIERHMRVLRQGDHVCRIFESHQEQFAAAVPFIQQGLARRLPDCQADPALLKQVWLNLLSNALKYTGKRDTAVIEIGSCDTDAPGAQTYFIRDNGVGFDMQYAQKLFGVFQRMHRAEDYAGTGVGLAIVQRVVHRHGGRVWADSRPNAGATFYFTITAG